MTSFPYSPGQGATIVAAGYACHLRVKRGNLMVVDGTGPKRRERVYERATFPAKRLVVASDSGYVTLDAIRWLADVGASLLHLDRSGKVLTVAGSFAGDRPSLRRSQALAATSARGMDVARVLITERIRGQAKVATQLAHSRGTASAIAERLADYVEECLSTKTTERLRSIEANAGDRYWKAWSTVPIRFSGPGSQSQVPSHWRTFGTRHSPLTQSPHMAVSPINAMMNYLLAIVEGECRLSCLAVGLDPGLGIVHADRDYRDSLALDVMEAARSSVESWLLKMLCERTFTLKDFVETRRGEVRLTPPIASWLASTADSWESHCRPVATWVAAILADQAVPVTSETSGFQRKRAIAPTLPPRCRNCGAFLQRHSGEHIDRPKLCHACDLARSCHHCGGSLKAMRIDALYCSRQCGKRAYESRRSRKALPPGRKCSVCAVVLAGRQRYYCSRKCSKRAHRVRQKAQVGA